MAYGLWPMAYGLPLRDGKPEAKSQSMTSETGNNRVNK